MPDISLTVTIPDAHVSRVVDAVTANADRTIKVEVQYGCSPSRTFSYEPKQVGETNQQFGQRVVAGFIRALVRCHEFAADHQRFVAEQATITQPTESVPDEVVG